MNEKWRARLSGTAITAAMLLAMLACNFPGLKPTPDFDATAVVRTVLARQTYDAIQTAPVPTRTWAPGQQASTAGPTSTQGLPSPTSTPEPCIDRLRFITDVTIPDGSYLSPGAGFEKTWRLLNAGTCTWTPEYALVFDSGDSFQGDPAIPLTTQIVPGSTVDLSIDLIAPQSDGSYEGYWMLRNDGGTHFGLGIQADKPFWVRINVGSTPTPAP